MATRVLALNTARPAQSLSLWLAAVHPDIFLTVLRAARVQANAKAITRQGLGRLRGLGDDDSTPDLGTDDSSSDVDTSSDDNAPIPAPIDDSGLEPVTVEDVPPPNIVIDDPSPSSTVSGVAATPTSTGSTLGSTLASAGSSVLGALGSVASYLTSAQGLNTLAGVAKSYLAVQASKNQVQTQQAILSAQLARLQTGQTAAPITYINGQPYLTTTSPTGQVTYQPLTSAGLASLTPSSLSVFLSQYGLWLALGLGVLLVASSD